MTEYRRNNLTLFLDAGTITVVSKTWLSEAIVKGSAIVNDYYKYQQQTKLLKELEALRLSARLLADEKEPKLEVPKVEVEPPPTPMRVGTPIAALTDTEVLLSAPRRQFP